MYDHSLLVFYRAVSPLHPGSGEGLGYIDRPIQRRSDNQHPKMEGSGVKGVLREAFRSTYPAENKSNGKIHATFGPENQDDSQKSALTVQDARILLFPVSSPVGNTLYLTCPLVLEQFKAEHKRQKDFEWSFVIPTSSNYSDAYCLGGNANGEIALDNKLVAQKMILTPNPLAEELVESLIASLFDPSETFYREFYKQRLVVVHNDVFSYFVKYRTEVVTGNKIDPEKGVVATGALFNHEYLPEGTVLYNWLEVGPEKKEKGRTGSELFGFVKQGLTDNPYLVLGGRTTVGKGQVAVRFNEASQTSETPA